MMPRWYLDTMMMQSGLARLVPPKVPGRGDCRMQAAAQLRTALPEPSAEMQADSGSHPGQLGALEKLAQGKGKMQAAQQHSHAPDVAPLLMRSYLDQRAKRLLYADKDLHVLVGSFLSSVSTVATCMMPPFLRSPQTCACALVAFLRRWPALSCKTYSLVTRISTNRL